MFVVHSIPRDWAECLTKKLGELDREDESLRARKEELRDKE